MRLAPGSRLGACQIDSALGAGGMGEVYEARDTRLDRVVAITGGTAAPKTPVALFQTFLARGTNVIGNTPQYAVSRDRRFLLNSIVETASPLVVIAVNGMGLSRDALDGLSARVVPR